MTMTIYVRCMRVCCMRVARTCVYGACGTFGCGAYVCGTCVRYMCVCLHACVYLDQNFEPSKLRPESAFFGGRNVFPKELFNSWW
eukprot:m.24226 g.24226  ORF g.24226 m.24226 type:complete len:85 (-) comp14506_c0_seq1:195-449(-)